MNSDYSFIANAHPSYIEGLYKEYVTDPNAIDQSWAMFFKGFDYAAGNGNGNGHSNGATTVVNTEGVLASIPQKEIAVMMLIDGYRHRGHLLSTTNPLKPRKDRQARLSPANYGLEDSDMAKTFVAGDALGLKNATLSQIVDRLKAIYGGNIGFEYSHIENFEKRTWLRERIEKHISTEGYGFNIEKKKRILEKLNEAVGFEEFLGKKFIGKKRFSLEGGESTIAVIRTSINDGI